MKRVVSTSSKVTLTVTIASNSVSWKVFIRRGFLEKALFDCGKKYLIVVGSERHHADGKGGEESGENLVEEPPAQDKVDSNSVESISRPPQGVLLIGYVVTDDKVLGEADGSQVVELLGEQPREISTVALTNITRYKGF